jgi:sterol desaturase/sphingolipid hydroxylase (fatty acid hydroxylase superfamily)
MSKQFVSNREETVRMFNSGFFEFFSKVHPSVPLVIYLPVIFYSLYMAFLFGVTVFKALMLFLGGVIIWTLTEYLLHRFVFHFVPSSNMGKRIHFIFHGVHHDYPKDPLRLVMPPAVSIPLALLFYYLFSGVLGRINADPFFAGFITDYLVYDMSHYALHHFNFKAGIWLYLKKHHARHHYLDSDKGYGVSSPLWDLIFNTKFKISS